MCLTLPPVLHLMAPLADGITLKTWHLIVQELEQTEQSALDVLKEQSFLPVQGAITSVLLWSKQGRVNNFGNFLWSYLEK